MSVKLLGYKHIFYKGVDMRTAAKARAELTILRNAYWKGRVSHDDWFIVGCALSREIKELEDKEKENK